ncbi:Caspase domain-containing protein [Rhizobium sp. RU20A]|uniref:caspase family protein n=1 Tax=Rhizobium sp. RU20A TaxID=1907412 RepID=UPI0009563AEF|nr:caspase family protein [Rhizobium sp. RU20A]SIQ00385.1 Caspase domain-containing protein [Rhizobium sp. RU20A]
MAHRAATGWGRARLALATGAALLFGAATARAETYALVVGINHYPYDVSLDGALQDAEDVGQALRKAGIANVAEFLNEKAVKADIRRAWQEEVERAGAGDTIIFHYAGHGAQMPELVAGDEADGLDEFLQLPGFDRTRAKETQSEIIVDNELNSWFQEAEAKGVHVLFVSDSCFSGGMSRSATGKLRLAAPLKVKLPITTPEAVEGAKLKESNFQLATVLAASLESQPTPEVVIGDKPRGALSWSFARALEGAADRNGDDIITRVELEKYVFAVVKSESEALQVPNFTPQLPRSEDEVVIRLPSRAVTAPGNEPVAIEDGANQTATGQPSAGTTQMPGTGEPPQWHAALSLRVIGQAPALENIVDGDLPYEWDVASGVFRTPNGDVAGEDIGADRVQSVIDKFILLDFLKFLALKNPGDVSLKPFQDIYAAGDRMTFSVPDSGYRNRLVFNLANTGEVQFLDMQVGAAAANPPALEQLEVTEPYGADHLIVISTNEQVKPIGDAIANTSLSPATLLSVLRGQLEGTETAIAIQPLYTRENR